MFKQTREKDIQLFIDMGNEPQPATLEDIPFRISVPRFCHQRTEHRFHDGLCDLHPLFGDRPGRFQHPALNGYDDAAAFIVSLPFKLLLFVMVDGWYLLVQSLVLSFAGGS
jgi:flagellar biosynthetic protein FliP